jgi:acetate kinase
LFVTGLGALSLLGVCRGFERLGIELDETANRARQPVISSERSPVRVFVINTNEEIMIARHTARLLRAQTAIAAE